MPKYPKNIGKTLSYDSPSGKINIGKWQPPFAKVPNGFGFLGVIAEDVGTGKLQCHKCGKWYEQLSSHIFPAHKMKRKEYKEKFGLFVSTALKSKRLRLINSRVCKKLQEDGKMNLGHKGGYGFSKNNILSNNRKGTKKVLEGQNKFGVCDLQIAEKVLKLTKKLEKTPTLTQLVDEYGWAIQTLIHLRYKSYISYVKTLGLTPGYSNYNPKYSREYFAKHGAEAVLDGSPLKVQQMFNQSEQRNIYNYYKSWGEVETAVEKELA